MLLGWQSSFRFTTGTFLFFKRNKIMYYKALTLLQPFLTNFIRRAQKTYKPTLMVSQPLGKIKE